MCENCLDNETIERGFLRLYESFTNEEYDESNCMSYSKIKNVHDNPEILTKERTKSNKEWLIFGTIVDILLTEPEGTFNNKVIINDKVPSEQYINIVNYILENNLPLDISTLTDEQIEEVYTKSGSESNWKVDTKRKKLIENASDYLTMLSTSKDKFIISTNTYNEALTIVNTFRTHPWTKRWFLSPEEQKKRNIELYYQFKIKYLFEGIKCQSKIDIIEIDHNIMTISLLDIKTGSDLPREFIKNSLFKYGYGYQGVLYNEGFDEFITKIPAIQNYILGNFKFLYVSRLRPTYPVILSMDSKLHREILDMGIESGPYELLSLRELFEEASFYIDQINAGKTNIEPYELQQNKGVVIARSTVSIIPY